MNPLHTVYMEDRRHSHPYQSWKLDFRERIYRSRGGNWINLYIFNPIPLNLLHWYTTQLLCLCTQLVFALIREGVKL